MNVFFGLLCPISPNNSHDPSGRPRNQDLETMLDEVEVRVDVASSHDYAVLAFKDVDEWFEMNGDPHPKPDPRLQFRVDRSLNFEGLAFRTLRGGAIATTGKERNNSRMCEIQGASKDPLVAKMRACVDPRDAQTMYNHIMEQAGDGPRPGQRGRVVDDGSIRSYTWSWTRFCDPLSEWNRLCDMASNEILRPFVPEPRLLVLKFPAPERHVTSTETTVTTSSFYLGGTVMTNLLGGTLGDVTSQASRQRMKFTLDEVARLIYRCLVTLDAFASAGYVHTGIDPSRIMFYDNDNLETRKECTLENVVLVGPRYCMRVDQMPSELSFVQETIRAVHATIESVEPLVDKTNGDWDKVQLLYAVASRGLEHALIKPRWNGDKRYLGEIRSAVSVVAGAKTTLLKISPNATRRNRTGFAWVSQTEDAKKRSLFSRVIALFM